MIEIKEVIIVKKRDYFIKKRSIFKSIMIFFKNLFKKEISDEEIIYKMLAKKYSI